MQLSFCFPSFPRFPEHTGFPQGTQVSLRKAPNVSKLVSKKVFLSIPTKKRGVLSKGLLLQATRKTEGEIGGRMKLVSRNFNFSS